MILSLDYSWFLANLTTAYLVMKIQIPDRYPKIPTGDKKCSFWPFFLHKTAFQPYNEITLPLPSERLTAQIFADFQHILRQYFRLRMGLLGLLNFLQELFQSFFKSFSRDLAALDCEGNCLVVYFILHTSSFRAFWQRPQGLCTARLTKVTFRWRCEPRLSSVSGKK